MQLRFSLSRVWMLLVLFSVIMPTVVIVGWYGQHSYFEQLKSALQSERYKHELLSYKIESEIIRFKTLLKNKSDTFAFLVDKENDKVALNKINHLLRLMVKREDALHEVMIMSKDGRVTAAFHHTLNIMADELLTSDVLQSIARQWGFSESYDMPDVIIPLLGRIYIGSPRVNNGVFAFSMAVPIGDPAKAVLVAIIEVDKLWSMALSKEEIVHDNSAVNYILDRRGSLITTLDEGIYVPGALMTHLAITRSTLIDEGWDESKIYTGVSGEAVFGVVTKIPVLNWSLISEVFSRDVTNVILKKVTSVILLFFVGLMFFIILILYLAKKTIRPIERACEAINSVAKGSYQFKLEHTGIRELDIMTDDIIEMAKSREKVEKILQDKEKEQQDILDTMFEAVITIDEHGRILSFNKTAETLFDYTADEVLGSNVNCLMPPNIAHAHDDYLDHYMTTGEAHVIGLGRDVEGQRKDKTTFPLRLFIVELPDDGSGTRRFIGTCLDLTQIKQQEEQLRRTQKMNALGKLTGGIAHDYNNMLGVILGYADLLKDELHENPKLVNYVKQIHAAGARGAKLTKRLLHFSRNEAIESSVVDVNLMLQEQQDMLQKTLTVRIKLVLNLGHDIWPIWLDVSDFNDAILNMSINSMHAMQGKKENVQLTIKTRNQSINTLDGRMLELTAGDYVVLSLVDTGNGMDEDTREKVFDPFFSTKGNEGTGLGLSQVAGFVKRSLGAIKVYSEQGKGSKFELYFPRYVDDHVDHSTEISLSNNDLSGKERILVVDDEEGLRDLSAELLRQQGYYVVCAKDATEALRILEQESIDLMLSDVIMPGMDGYQLAEIVHKKYPVIKIQLASGFTDDRHMGKVSNIDWSVNLLHKPYTADGLLSSIRYLLDN